MRLHRSRAHTDDGPHRQGANRPRPSGARTAHFMARVLLSPTAEYDSRPTHRVRRARQRAGAGASAPGRRRARRAQPGSRRSSTPFSHPRAIASSIRPLPELLRRGGFTGDLGVALRANAIDIAVHLWKDLPFAGNPLTHIAATLPRADTRDVLLVKRELVGGRDRNELRVLSTSARRRTNLSGFLQWALPTKPPRVVFVLARGDCEARTRAAHGWRRRRAGRRQGQHRSAARIHGRRIRRHSHARARRARCLRNHGAAARAESHRAGAGRARARDPPRSRRPRRVVSRHQRPGRRSGA